MRRNDERRGSVIDLCLILLLLAIATGAILRLFDRYKGDEGGTGDETASLSVSVSAIPSPIADCLSIGDVLYTADGTPLGTLTALESAPARVILEENGRFLTGTTEDGSVDLHLTVFVRGSFGGSLFYHNGRTALPVGKQLLLYTDRASLFATVVDVAPDAEAVA